MPRQREEARRIVTFLCTRRSISSALFNFLFSPIGCRERVSQCQGVHFPRAKGRLQILKVHAKSVKLAPEVDLWAVAKNLPRWSGAELAQLLQEGAMMAVRNGHPYILQKDLDLAVDRITVGPQRAKLEYCECVSIVSRGEVAFLIFFKRRPQLLHGLQVFLGGRAAEELIYGRDTSNWSVASLREASWLARKLVTMTDGCSWRGTTLDT
ncbi:hypothetical protein GOP47_0011617 [Adiantum capillus-veneris]|uniref:AAA ATPase AAA+ lid domain-containing protein n=1 Tax=Adiantum capillus-veneris TaxID=13818 RepID=A0A9D4UTI5_ADICA|nr:hypothetical protein GOP47_0011617 [Adiantum capillus-veneris]